MLMPQFLPPASWFMDPRLRAKDESFPTLQPRCSECDPRLAGRLGVALPPAPKLD